MNFDVLCENDGLYLCEMNEAAARDIAEWRYPPEYSMYDFSGYEEEEEQLFNGLHFPVYEKENGEFVPVGFVSVGPAAQVMGRSSKKIYEDESSTDIGLGLRPEFCGQGKGLGLRLVTLAAKFVKSEFPDDNVRLTVATRNKRAVKVYERAGFVKTEEFGKMMPWADGKKRPCRFVVMILE